MFARSIARAARPARKNIRTYATGSDSGGSGPWLWIGAAVLVGGGGYWYATQGNAVVPKTIKPSGNKAFQGGEQGFINLKLKSSEDLSHNTKRLVFALPKEDDVGGLPVASAVLTKLQTEGMEKPVMRPYTPTSDEDAVGYMEFVVKQYKGGAMSEHIHSLKPGDELAFKGPLPKYPIDQPNKHKHIAMIAGGTGITPMYQVMRALLQNPEDKTKVTLVVGNVTENDILLRKELQELENTYPQRFRAFYVLDNPPEGWKGGKGFITKELLRTALPEPKEDNIKVFVCGPPGMYKAISGEKKSPRDQGELAGILKELGYSKDQVYKF